MDARRTLISLAASLVASGAIMVSPARAQMRVSDLQPQFDRESNPVRKAKLLQRLGDAQFLEVHREEARENYDGVAKIYETYRDNIRSAVSALKGARTDAERHSEGYRQLQIELRKGIRDLDETIVTTPHELRPRLEALRQDLIASDRELIKLLFPRRRKPGTEKAGVPPGGDEQSEVGEPAAPAVQDSPKLEKSVTGAPEPLIKASIAMPVKETMSRESLAAGIAPDRPALEKSALPPVQESSESEPVSIEPAKVVEPAIISRREALQGGREKKDYLSEIEADKIRDAETSNQRIKLLLSFAADRLKKFQYELAHPSASGRHSDMLIFLMNAYAGCVDDAAEYVDIGREKQENVHEGIKEVLAKGKEFLAILEDLSAHGVERPIYKETLDDAIEGTRDAIRDAEKAQKEIAPPPVRRPK